jgi:hypothetical protein
MYKVQENETNYYTSLSQTTETERDFVTGSTASITTTYSVITKFLLEWPNLVTMIKKYIEKGQGLFTKMRCVIPFKHRNRNKL